MHIDMKFHMQQCAKWDKAHNNLKNSSMPEGKSYIKHAVNLLTMLEPIAEVHPVAKAVVGCFKQVVLFEQERQENDARVAAVILAQTDMMRVLLDIDRLSQVENGDGSSGNADSDDSKLQSIANLPALFRDIIERIKDSHNSIDTYYKEHRLVKFYRAREWKDRMVAYIADFGEYRLRLHQTLSMQVASGVNDLVTKMDTLLSHLFAPKETWEVETARRLDAIRSADANQHHEWIKNTQLLQVLVVATGDKAINFISESDSGQESIAPMVQTRFHLQLEKLRDDLQLSLDVLCDKNRDLFNLQLRLHTERLEHAIMLSARMVISTLEGPYNRLENEDLGKLWKEMNWYFCVETKVFSIAVFEYYLDLYSTTPVSSDVSTAIESTTIVAKSTSPFTQSYMPRASAFHQFKSGSLNHPEAWTLDFLLMFESQIIPLIDADGSGFIRISEVNAFTANIPLGWTVPQWCAYLISGQFHENSLYRKRIVRLRAMAHEMNAEILPSNQYASMSLGVCIDSFLHYLVLEPRVERQQPGAFADTSVPSELHDLVKRKMLDQDANLRQKVDLIKWTIQDEPTIHVLFGNQPLEEWILPLCCILMELVVDVHRAGTSLIMDFKQWLLSGYLPFVSMEEIVKRHIKNLQKILPSDKDIHSYHRGMWSMIEQTYLNTYDETGVEIDTNIAPITRADVQEYYSDLSFQDEFPIPELTGALIARQYKTWDEYIKDIEPFEVPESAPLTWSPLDADLNFSDNVLTLKRICAEWPASEWGCDKCLRFPGRERRFHCVVCPDFDLCDTCYNLATAEHTVGDHTFAHLILLETVWCQEIRHYWMAFRAELLLEAVREEIAEQRLGVTSIIDTDDTEVHSPNEWKSRFVCAVCATSLVYSSERIYRCVELSCAEVLLCAKCLDVRDIPNGSGHIWWHTLLPIDMRIVERVKSAVTLTSAPNLPSPPSVVPDSMSAGKTAAETDESLRVCDHQVEQRFADVVNSMATLESKFMTLQTAIRDAPNMISLRKSESLHVSDKIGTSKEPDMAGSAPTIDQGRIHEPQIESNKEQRSSNSIIDSRLTSLEAKVDSKISCLEERMSGLEVKMDDILKGLSTIIASLSTK